MTLGAKHWQRLEGRGLDFTRLGLGGAPLGNLYRAISDDQAAAVVDLAWEGGVRHFDTAPLYGFGLSETRFNRALRGRDRNSYVLSTKVGRLLKPCRPDERAGVGTWFDVPNRQFVYDYSYDGVMRSLEFSLERLGLDRVDILYVHDLDTFNHGTREAVDVRVEEFFGSGGYDAMVSLREQGTVTAIGGGVNEWEMCQVLAERGDFDLFLLAGRYTLLEQESLKTFLPLCEDRGIGVVIGGPYNSGILATGPVPGAKYNYELAPEPIVERVRRIEAVCSAHKVRLIDAAFHFPLLHPAVVSVIPGGQDPDEMASNLTIADTSVPADLWAELKQSGLMAADAPSGAAASFT